MASFKKWVAPEVATRLFELLRPTLPLLPTSDVEGLEVEVSLITLLVAVRLLLVAARLLLVPVMPLLELVRLTQAE
jgi:hypothetical protein